ncbi:wax ester/triacylglycerol synthase domain-containing protein [Nocardia sp. NPDC019395]|uniref:wax ester/triacylglycerol synthase domain-containing protein n=1 Tax=Nocardia sp. NPDC019395 TaxID=3154686 RepID=UPI0033D9F2FA
MTSLAAPDATLYWLSRRTRNDQFLLYCFAESAREDAELRAEILDRCAAIPELRVRLYDDPTGLAYPMWTAAEPESAQILRHRLTGPCWPELLAALGRLAGTGVDATKYPWLLHIFRGIRDSPVSDQRVTVVVLQISHALVDGRGASRIARALFTEPALSTRGPLRAADEPASRAGGPEPLAGGAALSAATARIARLGPGARGTSLVRSLRAAALLPVGMARTLRRGIGAARARGELDALTAAGRVPPPGSGYPPGPLNGPVEVAGHAVRMLVCPADEFRVPGLSVTVVGLTAVSIAIERYLRDRGADVTRLGAQVPMALPPRPGVRNNYRSLGVDLGAGKCDPRRRAATIAAELAARRERARHPLLDAQDAVDAVVPPLLLRRDVRDYPIHAVPEQITGHTVVSSVNRGPADLTFGGAPVRFTGGFPALGAVMHLTHGIHGLGETVTLSLHADPAAVPDPDTYAGYLREAVREMSHAAG